MLRSFLALLEKTATPSYELLKIWEELSFDEEYKHLDESLRVEIDFVFSYELLEDFGTAGDVNLVQSALSVTVTPYVRDAGRRLDPLG